MTGTLGDQAAAREEIGKGWKVGVQEFFRTVFWTVVNLGGREEGREENLQCQRTDLVQGEGRILSRFADRYHFRASYAG